MRIRILGTLEVLADSRWQPIGSPKWRSLLACLLLRAGQVVSTDALVDELWGEDPPDTARNLISIYALRVRRLLGDDRRLVFRAPGYVLNVADGDVDTHQFDALVADGRNALEDGDPVRAAALLSAALNLWRGPFLADVPPTALVATEADRAEELRLSATELWVQAHIASARPAEVIGELRRLIADNPLREGSWLLLMRALDAAGRHAEALRAYGEAREAIGEALGVDPGPELQQLYRELLAADTATAADMAAFGREPAAAAAAAGPPVHDEGIPVGDIPGRITMGSYVEADQPSAPASAPVSAEPSGIPASDIPRPAQLPADIGDFTGRESQVGSLCDMLTGGGTAASPGAVPIAFVAGAGGLGKTTLAIHAAHQIRDRFPDGQLYVDLLGATPQPLPPGDVLARFLRDLGVEGSKVPAGDEERAALYRTRLTGRRVLIVLDNARDNAQVRPLLPGSASCAVLVTTRNRTADLASTRYVDLHVLDDDEAVELFTRILGDDRPAAEPDATAEILVACAGLPLAIRICAARLAARRNWKIANMARRLRDERRRLDELKLGDLAVRASFQVSYDTLRRWHDVDPARAFRLLGLWQGASISLPGAAALIGAPEDDVADALESLVDANLLESSDSDRYRFHDLLRFYATERAQEEEPAENRAQAVRRLLEWYLSTADSAAEIVAPHRYRIGTGLLAPPQAPAAGPALATNEEALAWYDAERANLIAATRQAGQSGLHDVAWRLPTALFPVFNRRDNWTDCIASHRIALEAARLDGNRLAEGWASANLGTALARLRDREALGHLEQALAIRRELGDARGAAQATMGVADAYLQIEGPEVALEHFQRSAQVLGEFGDPSLLGICLNNLGEVYLELGRLDEAMDCFQQSWEVASPVAAHGPAHTLHNMGRVYLEKGHPQEAIGRLRESVELHQSTGEVRGQAIAWKLLGRAYRDAGDAQAARESWGRALTLYRQVGEEAEATAIEASIESLDQR